MHGRAAALSLTAAVRRWRAEASTSSRIMSMPAAGLLGW